MTKPDNTAPEILRDDILAVGVDDFFSMADVQGLIDDGGVADSAAQSQRLVIGAVRSLLEEGLADVGVIPSPSSLGFTTWPGTVDEVMTRFTDGFVGHYDDRHEWACTMVAQSHRKGPAGLDG